MEGTTRQQAEEWLQKQIDEGRLEPTLPEENLRRVASIITSARRAERHRSDGRGTTPIPEVPPFVLSRVVTVRVGRKELDYQTSLGVKIGDKVELPPFPWQDYLNGPNCGQVVKLGSTGYTGALRKILRVVG